MRRLLLFLASCITIGAQTGAIFPPRFPHVVPPNGGISALTLTKTSNVSTYNAVGNLITYTYTIKNVGTLSLNGPLVISDNVQGTIASCGTVPLAVNNTTSCQSNHPATQADLDNGSVVNTATATDSGSGAVSAPSTVTITAIQSPAISLSKVPNPASFTTVPTTITYTYTVTNTGNVTLTANISISDNLTGNIPICQNVAPLPPLSAKVCTSQFTATTVAPVTNTATASTTFHGNPVPPSTASATVTNGSTISVTTYGAKCDGSTDDGPAFRSALSAAASMAPPVTVTVPAATCIMGSQTSLNSGFNFYVPSNVTLVGTTGVTKIKQNAAGRTNIGGPNASGCTAFVSCTAAIANWGSVTSPNWHTDAAANYKQIQAPVYMATSITTATASDAAGFASGSYLAMWENASPPAHDTQNAQFIKVAAPGGNGSTGVIPLVDPVEVSFNPANGPPVINNITNRGLVHDNGASGIIFEEASLDWNNQTFSTNFKNVTFLVDYLTLDLSGTGGYNPVWQVNSIVDATWDGVTLTCSPACQTNGSTYWALEGPQRESGNILINNFTLSSSGFSNFSYGEWAKNITIQNSTFNCTEDSGTGRAPYCLGALSINGVVNNNTFNVTGDYNATNGAILTEAGGSGFTFGNTFYQGGNKFTNNTINNCTSTGGQCIFLNVSDTQVNGNTIKVASGNTAQGVFLNSSPYAPCCGALANSFQVGTAASPNNITTGGGNSIFVNPSSNGGWLVESNTTNAHITASPQAGTGSCTVTNNNTGSHGTTTGSPCTNSGNN